MLHWDYDVKAMSTADGLEEIARDLRRLGDEGWELVAVVRAEELSEPSVLAFLKRRLEVDESE